MEKKVSTASIPDYSIIYEVNLSIPKAKADAYQEWLEKFTLNVCQTVSGFTHAVVYSQPKPTGLHWLSEEGDNKAYFTVHYHVDSQDHLQEYLKVHQGIVAHAEQDHWGFIVTSRRILKMVSATIKN
ncbi:hypothetical protein HDV06_000844 [Boothiomyces sp. JEL0866]|nr:hypothetical protein HDV06_000844 [Boothiomyces sp. JEL0866]